MQKHIEFMTKITENPYYPVLNTDYPKLFDFQITMQGVKYFERLQKEWNGKEELSENEYLYLCMLHLGYAVFMKSPEECKKWQAYMFLIGKKVDLENSKIKDTLKQMGCIQDNPDYNPKLYKSHLLWKNEILDSIDAF